MMNGSRILEGYVPSRDATVVTRILEAGGRILGKSACEDLCFSGARSHLRHRPDPQSLGRGPHVGRLLRRQWRPGRVG